MIELKNITFAYPSQTSLINDVSVGFEKGTITTLLGPNGSGKSTLLQLMAGILKPQKGQVLLNGQNIRALKPKAFAKERTLLSQNHHPPEITVEELVAYGRYPHQDRGGHLSATDKAIIERAMTETGVSDLRTRIVSRLSGGQRQCAYIAMALAQDTPLVLLDEPTTYLDISVRFEVMEMVQRLNEQGKTIVMVLHDLDLALRYSQRIVVLQKGHLLAQGSPDDIVKNGHLDQAFGIQTHTVQQDGITTYHFMPRT